ncbi:zinc-binding dehydrogenase [Aestuariivirga sp.]|uniref:zinc-binding dehydrogenase n=1 Tax=Aestuariivirga sp. TaxID=2650926 RepID=UPI0039E48A41
MTQGVEVPIGNDGQGMQIASMDSLRTRGPLASFCNASGSTKALHRRLRSQRGTTFVTRSMMMSRTFSKEKPQDAAAELHKLFKSGKFNMTINHCYLLAEVAHAHRDLEAQKTTGSKVLVP